MSSRVKAELYLAYLRNKQGPPFLNDKLDIDMLEFAFKQHAAEQRQMCATDITEYAEMRSESLSGATEELIDACLNATGDSDGD